MDSTIVRAHQDSAGPAVAGEILRRTGWSRSAAHGTAVTDGLATLATDVTPLVLEHSGHYPAEQEPDRVNPAIVQFLQQHS